MKPSTIVLIAIILCLCLAFVIGFYLFDRSIPANAQTGMVGGSGKIVGHIDLHAWNCRIETGTYIRIFKGINANEDHWETRAFISGNGDYKYLGAFLQPFPELPVKFLCFEAIGRQYLLGVIYPENSTNQYQYGTFRIQRPESTLDRQDDIWKESTIEDSIFIVPIFEDEIIEWQSVIHLEFQLIEKNRETINPTALAWRRDFNPPINLLADCTQVEMESK